jgi:hypothetical protein
VYTSWTSYRLLLSVQTRGTRPTSMPYNWFTSNRRVETYKFERIRNSPLPTALLALVSKERILISGPMTSEETSSQLNFLRKGTRRESAPFYLIQDSLLSHTRNALVRIWSICYTAVALDHFEAWSLCSKTQKWKNEKTYDQEWASDRFLNTSRYRPQTQILNGAFDSALNSTLGQTFS